MTKKDEKEGKNKKEGMTPKQRCYPGELYALHRILIEQPLIDEADSTAVIFPTLFSKHSRTFHWMAIDSNRWQFDQESLRFDNVIVEFQEIIESYKKEYDRDKDRVPQKTCKEYILDKWMAYTASMPRLEQYRIAGEYIQDIIEALIDKKNDGLKKENYDDLKENYDDLPRLHKELLLLYEGYHQDRFLYLDGIVYRNLESMHKRNEGKDKSEGISWISGHKIIEEEKAVEDRSYWDYEWIDAKFEYLDDRDLKLDEYQCQEVNVSKPKEPQKIDQPNKEHLLSESPFQKALLSLFFPQSSQPFLSMVTKPIYDGWIGETECGALWGNLNVLFKDDGEHKHEQFKDDGEHKQEQCEVTSFINEEKLREFKDTCYLIVRELRYAALSIILSQPIKPPYDLIEHFVKHLRVLQDWERIIVFRMDGEEPEPQYCYRWKEESGKSKWRRCACNDGKHACSDCISWDTVFSDDGKYLCWNINLWNEAYIPSISKEEKQRYGAIRFAFEYPITSVIPKEDKDNENKDRKDLGETYIRQQLEVLRGLLRKVRARRSALRNASVSIMGRNMSHNIGSHVLARYASVSKEDMIKEDMIKEVEKFTRYLQERMDFIADVSTTDVFYSLPLKFYGYSIRGLVGSGKQDDDERQRILLDRISGLDGVKLILANKNLDKDFTYASPGGRLGMQALYVILENIARNTAKHDPYSWDSDIDIQATAINEDLKFVFNLDSWSEDDKLIFTRNQKDDENCFDDGEFGVTVDSDANNEVVKTKIGELLDSGSCELKMKEVARSWQRSKGMITISITDSGCDWEDYDFNLTLHQDVLLNTRITYDEKRYKGRFIEVLVWDDRRNVYNKKKEGEWLPDQINDKLKKHMIDDSGEIDPDNWGIREIFLASAYLRSVSLNELESRGNWPDWPRKEEDKDKKKDKKESDDPIENMIDQLLE